MEYLHIILIHSYICHGVLYQLIKLLFPVSELYLSLFRVCSQI